MKTDAVTSDCHALVEPAAAYFIQSLESVRPSHLDRPTPCRGWTLHDLLMHVNDSLDVLRTTIAVPRPLVAAVTAVELAVHGWDIAATTGVAARIPDDLATVLLAHCRVIAPPHIRAGLFDTPIVVPPTASPSERLLGYLGRCATRPVPRPPAGV
jgi:hypothetical protein